MIILYFTHFTPPFTMAKMIKSFSMKNSKTLRFICLLCMVSSCLYNLQAQSPIPSYEEDRIPSTTYAKRRDALRKLLPEGAMAVFVSATQYPLNDSFGAYRPSQDIVYLTGYTEPKSVLVIYKEAHTDKEGDTYKEILFTQVRHERLELYNGKRLGAEGAEIVLGMDKGMSMENFPDHDLHLPNLQKVFMLPFKKSFYDTQNETLATACRQKAQQHDVLIDEEALDSFMHTLRGIKGEEEIFLLKKAIEITMQGQWEAMRSIKPSMTERKVQAIHTFVHSHYHAEAEGFDPIVGAGLNGCTLHYIQNEQLVDANNLIVMDIGAQYHGYTADITRTVPSNGSFSKEQSIIYNIVLKAQKAGIKVCRKGMPIHGITKVCHEVVEKELRKIGLVNDSVKVSRYLPHGTTHHLGLDVHDRGHYKDIEPSMVITVEPGIYIPAGSPCDEKWWNIGVRIEDDILTTEGAPIVLTDALPRKIKEIEKIMQKESRLTNLPALPVVTKTP